MFIQMSVDKPASGLRSNQELKKKDGGSIQRLNIWSQSQTAWGGEVPELIKDPEPRFMAPKTFSENVKLTRQLRRSRGSVPAESILNHWASFYTLTALLRFNQIRRVEWSVGESVWCSLVLLSVDLLYCWVTVCFTGRQEELDGFAMQKLPRSAEQSCSCSPFILHWTWNFLPNNHLPAFHEL